MSTSSLELGVGPAAALRSLRFRGIVMDVPIVLTTFAICGLGFVVLYSAVGESSSLMIRQAIRFTVAMLVFGLVAQVSPRTLRMWSPWIFCVTLVLLGLVMVNGVMGGGAQRWLDLGIFRFQPSEIMKISVPMMVAWFLHERPLPPTFGQVLVLLLIFCVPGFLIVRQPDLGTALLVMASGADRDSRRPELEIDRYSRCFRTECHPDSLALYAGLPTCPSGGVSQS